MVERGMSAAGSAVIIALMFGLPLWFLGVAGFGYLQTGAWEFQSIGSLLGWAPEPTEWIGLDRIIAVASGLWVGLYSFAGGLLILIAMAANP